MVGPGVNADAGGGAHGGVAPDPPPVVLHGREQASGLADLLHQFFVQTLAADPGKATLARRLRGEVAFRAAEDPSVCVRIRFTGQAVELRDGTPGPGVASLTGDFLSVAHLTSGRESPMALVARRRIGVRFRPRDVPFLLRLLGLMRVDVSGPDAGSGEAARTAPRRAVRWTASWSWAAVAAGLAAAGTASGLAWCAAGGG